MGKRRFVFGLNDYLLFSQPGLLVGIRTAARGGGHSSAGLCVPENGFTIDLSLMKGTKPRKEPLTQPKIHITKQLATNKLNRTVAFLKQKIDHKPQTNLYLSFDSELSEAQVQ